MQFSYPTRSSCYVPCPLEDHDMVLVSNLDDGNISSIGRVLEIKAKELVVFILVKPLLQIGKKTRDTSAIVRVGDIEKGLAWC